MPRLIEGRLNRTNRLLCLQSDAQPTVAPRRPPVSVHTIVLLNGFGTVSCRRLAVICACKSKWHLLLGLDLDVTTR